MNAFSLHICDFQFQMKSKNILQTPTFDYSKKKE